MERRTDGLSLFLVDLREAGASVRYEPIDTTVNHGTSAVFLDDLELPADVLVGVEGKGFRHVLDGMNAERILLASESIGDARWYWRRRRRTHVNGGVLGRDGMAVEYDVERKFRESRLYLVAPVSNNLIHDHVAGHVLDLGRG